MRRADFSAIRKACASKPHGVRARYIAGCRCLLCRAANSRYECERASARRNGEWAGIVPADRARVHLTNLSHQGVGLRAVCAATDISRTILGEIRTGQRPRIRASTARKILAVNMEAASDHALIPARSTWCIVARLIEEGYTRRQIARWLGQQGNGLQLGKEWVTARNACAVERLYHRIQAGYMERAR